MMTVLITLDTAGADTGPFFNLYSDVDGYLSAFENVGKSSLLAGHLSHAVPDGTSYIKVQSHDNPYCTNAIYIAVATTTTTTTSSTTAIPFVQLQYDVYYSGEPECIGCAFSNGTIKVDGVVKMSWLGNDELPMEGPIVANSGQTVTINANCYSVGSGCVDIDASLVLYVNGVSVAEAIDGAIAHTFVLGQATTISVMVGCITPPPEPPAEPIP